MLEDIDQPTIVGNGFIRVAFIELGGATFELMEYSNPAENWLVSITEGIAATDVVPQPRDYVPPRRKLASSPAGPEMLSPNSI